MLFTFHLHTRNEYLHGITSQIQEFVKNSGAQEGICIVFCPHTTAAITINENADPDVAADLLTGLAKTFPDRPEFRHTEGNAAAHMKASCIGSSETILIHQGRLLLGTWQGIYFCEFDGPRNRTVLVKIIDETK